MYRQQQRPRRLEICGGIASGKTTLARLLERAGFTSVLEEFRRNPFLEAFYSNPAYYAFETELGFLLQHFHAIKKSSESVGIRACDFSFLLDRAYANVTLSTKQLRQFGVLLRWLIAEIGEPPLLIHLTCPPGVELERIRRRGRSREQDITEEYLADINDELAALLRRTTSSVLVLDSHRLNFANNKRVQSQVLLDIKRFVSQRANRAPD